MSLYQQFVSTAQKLTMLEIRRTCTKDDVHQSISTEKFTQIEKKQLMIRALMMIFFK